MQTRQAVGLAALFTVLVLPAFAVQEQRGAVVTGQIRTADGAPAAGVAVILTPDPNSPRIQPVIPANAVILMARTDDNGTYRITYVPQGRYYVHATPDGQLSTFFPGVSLSSDALLLDVVDRAVVTGVNFSLARTSGVRLTGRVRGVTSSMPAGSVLVLLARASGPGSPLRVPVRGDGTFEMDGIPPGTYSLRVSPNSYCGNPATSLEVRDRNVDSIQLEPAPLLFGRFIVDGGGTLPTEFGATRAYANLGILGDGEGCPQRGSFAHVLSSVQPDGVFVASVAAGEYKVDTLMLPIGYSVKSVTYGSEPLQGTLKVTREPTAEIQVILSPPTSGFRVTGRLTGVSSGQTAGARAVNLQRNVASPISSGGRIEVLDVPLQPDGTFEFRSIPAGTYRMQARPLADPPPGSPYVMSGSIQVVVDRDLANVQLPRAIQGGIP